MTADLFHVETSLSRLHAQRDDLISEMQVAPTVDDQVRIGNAIEAVEGLIRDEAKPNSVRKVDNFRGYILHLEMLEAAAKKEKQVQAAHEKQARDTIDFMKRIAAATMEATGKERLEGTLGHIRFQTNGGTEPPPLISQPELVPDELCAFTGNLHWRLYDGMIEELKFSRWKQKDLDELRAAFTRVPSPALIREALLQPCAMCDGLKEERSGVCHCGASMSGPNQCDNHSSVEMVRECVDCGGSGRASVPGCSLQQRQRHVRIA